MLARKLKSMNEIKGRRPSKHADNQGDFRVRKVGKSSKKNRENLTSLTSINDVANCPNHQGISIIKSLKEIGSNK